MSTKTMTLIARIHAAQERLDEATTELLAAVEICTETTSAWQRELNRRRVFQKARRYTRALDALSRVRVK